MLSWNTALFLSLNTASRPGPMLQGLVVAVAFVTLSSIRGTGGPGKRGAWIGRWC